MSDRIDEMTIPVQPTEENSTASQTAEEIKFWLVSYLAALLKVEASSLDVTRPINRYGVDSSLAIGLIGDLEEWLGFDIEPTFVYEYPTLEAMAQYLAEESQKNREANE